MKKKKGFTLVEMIAVIAIIGITGALVFTLFGKTHKVFSAAEKESVDVDSARSILSVIGEDIMMANSIKAESEDSEYLKKEKYSFDSTVELLLYTQFLKKNEGGSEETYNYIYTQEKSKNTIEINKYKVGVEKDGKYETNKISTFGKFLITQGNQVEIDLQDARSYTISIKHDSDILYETIITRRK
ncbi:type II secretion system protein [Clostridium intestinale]|uniref:type II secretion system protein n=1 Tax=Clostridium intestinale TaxID=36845 RepID=UPI002DD67ED7|nr:type II secretion system protein [Clostridium intestinale]WRY49998.1 type II secretion system protein [Clostridium intestinale]